MSPSPRPLVTGFPSTMGDDVPLNTTTLIRHAARSHAGQEIVFRSGDGGWDRYTYAQAYARIGRLANALRTLGVDAGDRVGVLDWNSRRHFELYWAVPGIAACLVQLNIRLGATDLTFVCRDSGASVVVVDETLLGLAEGIAPSLPGVHTWVVMSDRPLAEIGTSLPNAVHYEDLLAAADEAVDWPEIDERSACAACYTTGTTGRPKGVYYSHRAMCLHTYAVVANVGITLDDVVMIITPMFHVSAWGLPHAGVLVGAKIVLSGRFALDDMTPLTEAMIAEGVTVANGAPSIFGPMLREIEGMADKPDLTGARLMCGATEPPLTLMRGFAELTGAEVVHAYGASETTPMATINRVKRDVRGRLDDDGLLRLKRKQGYPITGVDIRLVSPAGDDVPWDGVSQGEVYLRGPWITSSYRGLPDEELADRFENGWWRSGDVGTIDPDGYLKLTDRLKDVIKSGGEWISSIDMENLLASHPKVAEAAVVGIEHPTWQERPFVLVVAEPGADITLEELHEHLSSGFASWQLPDDFDLVVEIPRTSVGKFDKKTMRARYADVYRAEPRGQDAQDGQDEQAG